MLNFFRGGIRASAFFQKEIFEILRQPRLVATLVLGPFLILFIFGLGYRAQPKTLRTLFVAYPDSPFPAQEIPQYAEILSYAGVTADEHGALVQLQTGQVDLVVVEPRNITPTIQNNEQAVFTLYHQEIDPVQADYVNYLGWLYAGEFNKKVLRTFVAQGQADTADLHLQIQAARQNVADLRQAVQSGDTALAQQKQQGLADNVDAVALVLGASLRLLDSLQQTQSANPENATTSQNTLADLRQNVGQLNDSASTPEERLARLDAIDQDLNELESQLAVFRSIQPDILISPFRSETKSIANFQPSNLDFFAPAVLALLLQHLAVTFAALSIVRERIAGTLELFRVSPLSAAETLFGKYLSYLLFGGIIAALLSALLVLVLQVPMLGYWEDFALVVVGVLFTSLGIGFIISLISQTDSQAVQYSMLVLLASVFFSGFIMSLEMLWEPVRMISWLLPTTYGTLLLRDIALRGLAPDWLLLGGLGALGLVWMMFAWHLLRRLITLPR